MAVPLYTVSETCWIVCAQLEKCVLKLISNSRICTYLQIITDVKDIQVDIPPVHVLLRASKQACAITITCRYVNTIIYTTFSWTGIVAGMWPCGKITLIGELFSSESLSQVYGFLHTFVHENRDSLKDMSTQW